VTFRDLPHQMCDPSVNTATFTRLWKTHLFSIYWHV